MGQPTHLPVRQRILELRSQGETIEAISSELNLSFWTVRNLVRRQRGDTGQGCEPNYKPCGRKGILRSNGFYKRAGCWLKRLHPLWGAPYIHLRLSQRYTGAKLPCPRQFQRWFRELNLGRPRQIKAEARTARATEVHECWQVDAKERMVLTNGQVCCYLSVVDEYSGSALGAHLFSTPPHQSTDGAGGL
jgi:hypothetical protein